jgi:hypothetical protein
MTSNSSIYTDIFESLLRGNSVELTNYQVNQRSLISQFSKFKAKQFGADWLRNKTLGFETSPCGLITTISLIPYQRVKTPITFKVNSYDQKNLPTIVGADQSG